MSITRIRYTDKGMQTVNTVYESSYGCTVGLLAVICSVKAECCLSYMCIYELNDDDVVQIHVKMFHHKTLAAALNRLHV